MQGRDRSYSWLSVALPLVDDVGDESQSSNRTGADILLKRAVRKRLTAGALIPSRRYIDR